MMDKIEKARQLANLGKQEPVEAVPLINTTANKPNFLFSLPKKVYKYVDPEIELRKKQEQIPLTVGRLKELLQNLDDEMLIALNCEGGDYEASVANVSVTHTVEMNMDDEHGTYVKEEKYLYFN